MVRNFIFIDKLLFTIYQQRQAAIICKHFKTLMQDIFIYSLVAPQPNVDLCQGHIFTHPILITASYDFYLKFTIKLLIRYVHASVRNALVAMCIFSVDVFAPIVSQVYQQSVKTFMGM